jgi:hypothetical protein
MKENNGRTERYMFDDNGDHRDFGFEFKLGSVHVYMQPLKRENCEE